MKYYRVKPEFDQKRISKLNCDVLIKDELYTASQFNKLGLPDSFFDVIEISQRNTYWCFGARFECNKN